MKHYLPVTRRQGSQKGKVVFQAGRVHAVGNVEGAAGGPEQLK